MYPSPASSDSAHLHYQCLNLTRLEESKPVGVQWLRHCPSIQIIRIQLDEIHVWTISIIRWEHWRKHT